MRTPLQDQLLKAGLAKKSKVADAVREQNRQRHAKTPSPDAAKEEARQRQVERAQRDRELAAERNAQARLHETRGQVRQIVDAHRVKSEGEIAYGFQDGDSIKRILVDAAQRSLLAKGSLVIVRDGDSHALLPRAAADKVYARDEAMVVLDHGRSEQPAEASEDDPYYSQFQVPDDLVW